MFGLTRISILALLLTPAALASSHSNTRSKRRHGDGLAKRADTPLPEQEFSGNGTEHSLAKRAFNGRGTFYYTGLGACGQYSKDSDYMVALNSAQYGGGYPGPQCFKMITVQANGVTVGGVQIMDECPTCDYGGLDLSPGLFTRFADEGAGVIQLTWWFDGDSPAPAPQTSTTSEWVAPSTTYSPPPAPTTTSTWTPPTSTSTWVAPTSTSTYVAPSPSTSTSTSTSTVVSSSTYSSVIASSSIAINSTNPFAVVSNSNSTSTSLNPSASALPSGTVDDTTQGTGSTVQQAEQGNLAAINGLVAQYGQLIVVGAGGHP